MRFEITGSLHFQTGRYIAPPAASGVIPVNQVVRALVPYHAKKAFDRANWQRDKLCCDVLRRDLYTLKGKPLGTVFAKEVNP